MDPGDGLIVLFAESYRHLQMTETVFRALAGRGRHPVLVAHRRGRMGRPSDPAVRLVPLDRYLSPGGLARTLAAVRRFDREWPPASRIEEAAGGAEWRSLAGAARRERLLAAVPFVVGLVERVRRICAVHRPSVGITLTEMGAFGQTIARAGRRFGMATLNMEHGIKTHLPMVEAVIADRIAAFGPDSAETLVRQGADPAAIVLTGVPRYDPLFRGEGLASRGEILPGLGLDSACRLVVFASYPLAISGTHTAAHKEALVRALADAVARIPGGALVVKLHPQEEDAVARNVLAEGRLAAFRVVSDIEAPLYPLLAACDVLATYTSTTALEAAILGKPILIANLSGLPDATPYVRAGIALYTTAPAEIGPAIARLLDDPALRGELASARRRFVERYAFRADGRAAERVAGLIERMIAEGPAGADAGPGAAGAVKG
jgi:glycosyltransferase involved in cell wall biosynthesis